jgi:DNA (cytosine-5)-methyltransferase 1
MNKMKAISLFSGCGGDTLGLEMSDIDVIAYVEKERVFQETHNTNFPNSELIGSDIAKIPDKDFEKYKGKIDIIFAGFPCQGFSNAGKKQANDPRNTLFKEFARAVKIIKPKYIIGENVKGLLSRKTDNGEDYIDIIEKEFTDMGYIIKHQVCKTHEYGVPQKRERLIIIGTNTGKTLKFPEPFTTSPNLQGIISFNMKGALKIDADHYNMAELVPAECILTDKTNTEDTNDPHPFLTLRGSPSEPKFTYNGITHDNLISFAKRSSGNHIEVIDIRKPSKTIICTYGHQPRLFVPLKNANGYFLRALLPDELKQIQGFPADYTICGNDSKKIIQIGNAVPPPLIKVIVEALIG